MHACLVVMLAHLQTPRRVTSPTCSIHVSINSLSNFLIDIVANISNTVIYYSVCWFICMAVIDHLLYCSVCQLYIRFKKNVEISGRGGVQDVFDDKFWGGLDVVVNALDNVNARLYVDSRCVYFQRPLLESGTLGAKCNTQMVIPNITENYGAHPPPPPPSRDFGLFQGR